MSIEISATAPPSSTTKPAVRAQNTAGDAPAVSFLSLLSTLGLGAADATETATAMSEPLVARNQDLTDALTGTEPGNQEESFQASQAQMLLASDWRAAAAPAVPPAAGVVTATVGLPGHAHAAGQALGAGQTAASVRARAMGSTQPAATDPVLSQPAPRQNGTSELQQLSALALTSRQDGDAMPVSPRDFMARVEAARLAAEPDTTAWRAASATLAGSPSPGQVVSMFDAAAAGLRGGGASRSQERHQPRLAGAGAAQAMVAWGDATPAGTQHGASPVYAPGALTPAPATAMAEKVHYWVSRGVQSASLQLEAFAGGSVDVSIAVRGDEAVVEFRTDQPQARQLLLEAMPQLKELLAHEGLMLSGGFVGGSAQQGGQSHGRDNPQSASGDALVAAPQAVQGLAEALDGVSGSRVDLFV